jgi:hypothetical protein
MNLGGNDDEIKQAFQSVDADYSGLIEWSEFSKSIKESVTYLVVCLLTEIYLIVKFLLFFFQSFYFKLFFNFFSP